mgnify:CR=1 FL=1
MNYKLLFIFSLLLIVGCSNSVDPKYVGTHDGRWEGILLNQYNQGSATFTVKESGNAKLVLRGKFSATHKGKIKNNFILRNGKWLLTVKSYLLTYCFQLSLQTGQLQETQ